MTDHVWNDLFKANYYHDMKPISFIPKGILKHLFPKIEHYWTQVTFWQEIVEITYINPFDVWFRWFLYFFGINTNFAHIFFYNIMFSFRFFFIFYISKVSRSKWRKQGESKRIRKVFVCENGNHIREKNPIFEVVLAINTEIIKAIHDMKVQK